MRIREQGALLEADIKHPALVVEFPASRTGRNKFLVLTNYPISWIFKVRTQMDQGKLKVDYLSEINTSHVESQQRSPPPQILSSLLWLPLPLPLTWQTTCQTTCAQFTMGYKSFQKNLLILEVPLQFSWSRRFLLSFSILCENFLKAGTSVQYQSIRLVCMRPRVWCPAVERASA